MRAILLAVALLATTGSAQALSIQYTLQSSCVSNCAAINRDEGSPLFGLMEVSILDYVENGQVGRADLVSLSVQFLGGFVDLPTLGGYSFGGAWGARPGDIDDLELSISGAVAPNASGPFFTTGSSGTAASLSGICLSAQCQIWEADSLATFAPLKVVQVTGGQPAPVPLPPAGALLLLGVAALALSGRSGGRKPGC